MSEERRKRQQARAGGGDAGPKPRKFLLWGGIVFLFVGVYSAGWYRQSHHYDAFAKCLASKQAKMYGLYWCPHCIEQKQKFGRSFQYVPYQECAIKGSRDLAPECKAVGVKLFPSWQFGSNPPKEGIFSLEELGEKAGCSLDGSSSVLAQAGNAKREPPQPADAKATLLRDVRLQSKLYKDGLGVVADFTVNNPTEYRFKDFEVKCVHSAPSGTSIDSNTRTIYQIVEPRSTKVIKRVDMGFIHSQAVGSACQITDLVVVQ